MLLLRGGRRVDPRVVGRAELGGDLLVVPAGILACPRRHLRGEQAEYEPVLVGGPHRAVQAQKARARALLAPEAAGAVEKTGGEPLEPHGHLEQAPPQVPHYAIDEAAADQRLADRRAPWPARPLREQIADGHGEIVVGIQQSLRARDDAVAVRVGVVPEGDVEAVLQGNEAGHGIRTRAIHPDLAVVIDGHEPEGGVSGGVDHGEVQPELLGDDGPVPHRRAASHDIRFTSRLPSRKSALARSWIQPVTSVSAGPPLGGLYLKPPSAGGLCEGVTTIPSAIRSVRPRLCTRMTWEITGVGVKPS